jgi:DNA adenine methylase
VEPFAGSACFFFSVGPKRALINDINPHLIRTYKAVSLQPEKVYERYLSIPVGRDYYNSIRKTAFDTDDEILSAARFLYLNRNCFNGLYRTNLQGQFNVPFSDKRNGRIGSLETFIASAQALSKAQLTSQDFQTVLDGEVVRGDFVYLDPPFAVRNTRVFTQYGPDVFGTSDLDRLRVSLQKLDERGVSFLLSYADCPEARETFAGWELRSTMVQRHISGFSTHRKRSGELLVIGHNLANHHAKD